MGTWSIELPSSHPLASIDQTGKVTFQPHTEMTSYTIKFTGTTAETKCEQTEIRGNIVVYPCSPTTGCMCNVTPSGTKVPSTASSTKVVVGAVHTTGNCTNLSWSFAKYDGEDFLTGLEVRDNFVYAAVSRDNPSSSSRFVKYSATPSGAGVISGPSHFAVEQEGKGTPPVSTCPAVTESKQYMFKPGGESGVVLVDVHTDKNSTSMSATSNVTWIKNLSVVGRGDKYYQIMGTYEANNGSASRTGEVTLWCDSTHTEWIMKYGWVQFPN